MYKVFWKEVTDRQLSKLRWDIASTIKEKVATYLAQEPRANTHPLKGEYKGLWTHGVGHYRVIYSIDEANKTIAVVKVGPRKDVYD